jgi:hypothetical protein
VLGHCPFASCFVLQLSGGSRIVLDAGCELATLLRFYPSTTLPTVRGDLGSSSSSSSSSPPPPPPPPVSIVTLGIDALLDAPAALHLPPFQACPGVVPRSASCRSCAPLPLFSRPGVVASSDAETECQCMSDLWTTQTSVASSEPPMPTVVDASGIDAIFLSNPHSMWGLPALLQRFHLPSVRVYATEPTLRLGRLLVQEFHHYHAQVATVSPAMLVPVTTRTPVAPAAIGTATGLGSMAVPPALAPLLGTGSHASGSVLQAPYTPAELTAAWARVTAVSLNEPVWLSPMWTARAVASGSSLGAVGWELVALSPTPGWSPPPPVSVQVNADVDADMDSLGGGDRSKASVVTATGTAALSTFRVLYLSRASGQTRRVPRCLDLDALCVSSAEATVRAAQNSPGRATVPDVLLLDDLSRQRAPPTGGPPPSADQALLEVGRLVVATVKAGGSVLLPIQADGGNCLDVLEHVCAALIAAMYLSVPVYVISPVMGEVLSTAAVFSEWMNDSRQERVHMTLFRGKGG